MLREIWSISRVFLFCPQHIIQGELCSCVVSESDWSKNRSGVDNAKKQYAVSCFCDGVQTIQ